MNLVGIDHLVLTVTDIGETCAFYEQLGAERVTFGDGRTALQFGDQKINLHGPDTDADLDAAAPQVGGGDFCVLTDQPIDEVSAELAAGEVDITAGPVERAGARGSMKSVYVRDPDGNLVEIAAYDG